MFVLVNLKTYDCDPMAIASDAAAVTAESDVRIGVAPQAADLERVAATGVETWAQHVDPIEPGSNTGHQLAETVRSAGATGTLVNHSERRLRLDAIDGALRAADRADLETIVCANNPDQIRAAAALDPDSVAVEPPALIGSGTPVSQADPAIVEAAVSSAQSIDPDIPVLCGAGIGNGDDVRAARDLGASGVLLASGVAKAEDPRGALEDLVRPL